MSSSLLKLLNQKALDAGFLASGGCDLESARAVLSANGQRYEAWLSNGFAAEMGYLSRESAVKMRLDPQLLFPAVKSIFCVLDPYDPRPHGALDPTLGPRVARYISNADYHDELKAKLEALCLQVKGMEGFETLHWKTCVDTSAALERFWANTCGLGFIGKNMMLIHPAAGSYSFIGLIFLNQPMGEIPQPITSRCGNCSRCREACPTQALGDDGLNSNRCISYRTLEKKSLIRDDLDSKRGAWIAGCDLCQEACPYNSKSTKGLEPRPHLTWQELIAEDDQAYSVRVASTALNRMKREKFLQNVKIAAENSGQ